MLTAEQMDRLNRESDSALRSAIAFELSLGRISEDLHQLLYACAIPHKIDRTFVSCFANVDAPTANQYFSRLAECPFINVVDSGLAFDVLVRRGILKTMRLKNAWLLTAVATAVGQRASLDHDEEMWAAESYFCNLLVGDIARAEKLQDMLVYDSIIDGNNHLLEVVLRFKHEAATINPEAKIKWLFERIIDFDVESSWRTFLAIHIPIIQRYARWRQVSCDSLDDVVQEVLLELVRWLSTNPYVPEEQLLFTEVARTADKVIRDVRFSKNRQRRIIKSYKATL